MPKRFIIAIALLAGCAGVVEEGVYDGGVEEFEEPFDASVKAGRDAGAKLDAGRADATVVTSDAAASPSAEEAGTQDPDTGTPAGAPGASGKSRGCAQSASGTGSFEMRSVEVGGVGRTYHVRIPSGYRASRAYPVVFRFHGWGGDGLSGGLGIEGSAGEDALIVAADGLEVDGPNRGWDEQSEPNDLMLFDAMYAAVTAAYCVDLARVFAYGFSMGGGMTNLLGCKRADKLRATAAIAGYNRIDGSCAQPMAAWFQHDRDDDAVPVSEGRGARDRDLTRNGCTSEAASEEDDCVRYAGCRTGFPVVYCETGGLGHNIAGDSAPGRVWSFFQSLP